MSSAPTAVTQPTSSQTPSSSSRPSTPPTAPAKDTLTPSDDDNSKSKLGVYADDNEKTLEKQPEAQSPVKEEQRGKQPQLSDDFPDGGLKAWLVVIGSMLNAFGTLGYVTSWGVFQAYYQEVVLPNESPSNIAWIGSMQYSLIFFPALIVGRLFDLGYYRTVLAPCTALLILSTFLVPQCTQYWHFLLCQGIAVGIASGGMMGATTPVIAHWFKKKRGLALGYFAVGASFGGIVLPIVVRNLIPSVGFGWTMRIIGFILLATTGPANLMMRRRLPPSKAKGGLLNLAAFKDPGYTIYCFAGLMIYLGLYTVLTYVSVRATQLGSSADLAFYFVSFANAGSLVGRYAAGILADRIGPLNVIIPFTLLTGVFTCIWPFVNSTGPLVVVTVLYGFCSGSFTALVVQPLMNLGGEADVGRRIGMFTTIIAFGALAGPPISGAISGGASEFKDVGLYAGFMVIGGVLLVIIVRRLILKGWIGKL